MDCAHGAGSWLGGRHSPAWRRGIWRTQSRAHGKNLGALDRFTYHCRDRRYGGKDRSLLASRRRRDCRRASYGGTGTDQVLAKRAGMTNSRPRIPTVTWFRPELVVSSRVGYL